MGLSLLHVMYAGHRTSKTESSGPRGWLEWPGVAGTPDWGRALVPQISLWAAFLAL